MIPKMFVPWIRFHLISKGILTESSNGLRSTCRGVSTRIVYSRFLGFAILVGTLGLSGCVADQAFRYYSDTKYPAKEREEVEVLWVKPERPFSVIADFQARRASIFQTRQDAAKFMQARAAQIGADAVIVGAYGGYRARSDKWAGEDSHATSFSRFTGTAIRYRSDEP